MNLVWFLSIGAWLSILFGELGRYPFGGSAGVRLTDICLVLIITFYLIWRVGIERQIKILKLMWPIIGFWAVGLLSLIVNWQFEGVVYLLRFCLYSSMFLISYDLVKAKIIDVVKLVNWLLVVGVGLVALGILQLMLFPNFEWLTIFGYDPHQFRLAGTFLDPNFMGCVLVLCSVLAWWRYEQSLQRIFLVCTMIFSLAILLTFSRSAYLVWLILSVIGLWRNFRRYLFLFVGLLLVCYLFIPRLSERVNGAFVLDKSSSARFESWERGIQAFNGDPILGVGFNNLRSFFQNQNLTQTYSIDGGNSGAGVDSSLLFLLATSGLVGMITFLIWPMWMIQRSYRTKYFNLVTLWFGLLLINSQFINSMFYPPVMLMTFGLMGSIAGQIKVDK